MRVGLKSIPAYIRTADDENVMEMALIENIQRQDLNSIEIALAYQHLMDQYGLTQERLSERVGKKRATVANYLRLLKLPAPVQVALQNREIDTGHARALLSLEDPKEQVRLFREVQQKGYSVRQVEDAIKKIKSGDVSVLRPAKKAVPTLTDTLEQLRGELARRMGGDVKISPNQTGGGKLTLTYKSEEDLRRIVESISL
jgi:ParB family chromosome partitioning protein